MAAPISEQSGKISDAIMEEPSVASSDEPSVLSSDVALEPDNERRSGDIQEATPVNKPENKNQEPAAPSAFHVVSYPDGHKELTTDILEACDPVTQPELSTNAGSSIEVEPPEPGEQGDVPHEPPPVKHFSATVVQQENNDNDDDTSNKDLAAACMTPSEGNQILAQSENKAVEMEGVNLEDIDDAVERALLDEVGEDSYGKSAGDNSNELEGLQTKAADLNGGSDPGQGDGPADPHGTPQTHRMEKVLNIDEETRMGLDATPVNDQSLLKESFTYPSLPPKKLFQIDDTKDSEASDTETKMSMTMTDTEDLRLRNTISIDDGTNVSATSDSNTEAPTPTSTRKPFRATREGIGVSQDGLSEGGERVFTAENLFEYQWPIDGGEWHLLQEQVSEYLSIKSFKRKYPDLDRRVCDKEEKDFLRDKGVVTETQSDLGLTALRSEEVYDLMMKDYNEKYQDYITFLQEKQKKVIREKHKEYSEQAKIDKSKMESYSKKAARSAAEFNANMMREKKDERRAYFDLQTYTVHFPKNKFATLPPKRTKIGAYPVAVLTGQYQDHYRRYNPDELKYLPVKTVLHDPRKPVKYVRPMPESVRLAIIEKQKPQPPPEEEMEVQEELTEDSSENKENNVVPESTVIPEDEAAIPAIETAQPVTPQVKVEKKSSIKSSSKKRPKIELSPERPKKTFKKARESLITSEAEVASEESVAADGTEMNKLDGKSLIPKIHGLEKCRICKQRSTKEERKNEKIVKCAQCGKIGHTSCLDLTEELVAVIKTYPWQCMECKTCVKCMDPFDEDKMMFCDRCDRGYHTFCIGLEALPTGHWECGNCEGVPIVLSKSKQDTSANVDKTIPEEAASEQVKSEVGELSTPSETTTYPPIEPTLEEKQELLEEGEISDFAPTTTTTEAESGLPQTVAPGSSNPTGVLTPGSVSKIERRGRKRKYPIDPNKPKVSHKKAKPAVTPKQDRVTGERQSRRLKQKEEEEEEKKKKEEEKLELKKKKKKKKLKKLAAEAAAAAAAAAALAYAASHPDEDCSGMLPQSGAQKMDEVPTDKTEMIEGAKDKVDSAESISENVSKDNVTISSSDTPENINTSEELSGKNLNATKVVPDVSDSEQLSATISNLQKSIVKYEQSIGKDSESVTGTSVETHLPKTEECSKDSEKPISVPSLEKGDSSKYLPPESSESIEEPIIASADDSAVSSSGDRAVVKEEAACDLTQDENGSAEEIKRPEFQKESQDTIMSNENTSETKPTTESSDIPSQVPKEQELPSESENLISSSQKSDQTVLGNPDPNPTQTVVEKEAVPTSFQSSEEVKENEQTEILQDKPKESIDTVPELKKSSEASLQLSSTEPKESEAHIPSPSLHLQTSSEESASQPQPKENLNTLSSPVTTSKSEDPLTLTQSSPELSQPGVSSVSENPQFCSTSESSLLPLSVSTPSTAVSDCEASSALVPNPSLTATEAPIPIRISDIPLPGETSEIKQEVKTSGEAVATSEKGISEVMDTESDKKNI